MYYYFSSDFGIALKINGIYYGTVFKTVKELRIDGDFIPLVEILPLKQNCPSVCFLLDENFINSPPDTVSVTDLKGGYLIKFNPAFNSGEFNVISQQKYPDALITVFNENGLKISIETHNDFYAETINFLFDDANIQKISILGQEFITILLNGNSNLLLVFQYKNSIKKIFCRQIENFSVQDNFLCTEEQFLDIAKHHVKSFWEFKDGNFRQNNVEVSANENFNREVLPPKLLPYAFLEEFSVKGDFLPYLCENMQKNADKLQGYLGNFIGVMPPPKFRKVDEVGLIYNLSKNRYKAEYFEFELIDGKITNIKKSD